MALNVVSDLDGYKLDTSFHINNNFTIHVDKKHDSSGRQVDVGQKWLTRGDIGCGTYGRVWLQESQPSSKDIPRKKGNLRALKEIEKWRLKKEKVDYKKELEVLINFSQIKYKHRDSFVEFLGWFENTEAIYIAMEYVPLGALDGFIPLIIDEDGAKQISRQLLEGLKYMHEAGYGHRDLKPAVSLPTNTIPTFILEALKPQTSRGQSRKSCYNVTMDFDYHVKPPSYTIVTKKSDSSEWWVKLADFGTSKRVVNNDTAFRTNAGTQEYQAPEFFDYLQGSGFDTEVGEYNTLVDIWSFACVVYEIMALRVPFQLPYFSPREFCKNIKLFPIEPFQVQPGIRTSAGGVDFIRSVLIPNPNDRPTAAVALQHAWFGATNRSTENSQSPQSITESSISLPQSYESRAPSVLSNYSSDRQALIPPRQNISSRQTTYDPVSRTRGPRNQYLHRPRP